MVRPSTSRSPPRDSRRDLHSNVLHDGRYREISPPHEHRTIHQMTPRQKKSKMSLRGLMRRVLLVRSRRTSQCRPRAVLPTEHLRPDAYERNLPTIPATARQHPIHLAWAPVSDSSGANKLLFLFVHLPVSIYGQQAVYECPDKSRVAQGHNQMRGTVLGPEN